MSPVLQYEYADGNANRYIIRPSSLEYVPVKKEESSSGMYLGGEPVTVPITSEQFAILQELFDDAIVKTEIHTEQREKRTGVILRKTSTRTYRIIIAAGSAEITAIEAALKTVPAQ